MGVTITAINSSYSFDMGAGFFNLRKNIAYCIDEEFGKNYEGIGSCWSEEDYAENDRKAMDIISRKKLDDKYVDVLDFLYASDCEGKVSYKTCGKIYDIIKNVDFGNKCFRYVAHAHNDYEEFKMFLKECYSKRRNMIWR